MICRKFRIAHLSLMLNNTAVFLKLDPQDIELIIESLYTEVIIVHENPLFSIQI